jgi:SH3-like domain-containing protein
MFKIFVFFLLLICPFAPTASAKDAPSAFRVTEFPLPRFVSTRSDEVYVRSGPGQKYPIEWIYKKADLPVEIVLEYDNWRKIKDFDGGTGWVHKSLLTGKRTAFVSAETDISLHKKPNNNSDLLAKLEPKVLLRVDECESGWCKVNASGYKGWIEQKNLWGVYAAEEFD